jgi:hypothetical protein
MAIADAANRHPGDALVVPSEYLEVVATRHE